MSGSAPFVWLLLPYALGAAIGPFARRRWACLLAHVAALVGSLAGLGIGFSSLRAGWVAASATLQITPFAAAALRIDGLSAYFLLVISVAGVAASLFAIGYVEASADVRDLAAGINLFLASMVLVVLANSAIAFLMAWELMSLVSFFLVIHDHDRREARRAGFMYLVMTHAGTGCLLAAFLLLGGSSGRLSFDAFRAAAGTQPAITSTAVALLGLVGFGMKAGVIPLHVWLPRAHPAAPSHVSALMSGVMIKTAIYGLLRLTWQFLGPAPAWWGVLILAAGCASAVLGVLYALMEHDLKRLLAYHSVENIGIILMGLGAAFVLDGRGHPTAAALALSAALFHTLNHAIFKSLLFLAAGAVQRATHSRNLEQLGGLIRPMPWTAAIFLVGSMAIAGLPPLNGFASEWLTFQALLGMGVGSGSSVLAVSAGVAAAMLALTGGLAAFCFVKAFGVAFLGMPRSTHVAAREVSWPMLAGPGLLAVLCAVLGLAPALALGLISPVSRLLIGVPGPQAATTGLLAAPSPAGSYAPAGVVLMVALCGSAVLLGGRLALGRARTRVAPAWACGGRLEPGMQYSGAALAKPIRLIFRALLRPYREIEREHSQEPYFVSAVRYEAGVSPVYERYLYRPAVGLVLWSSRHIRRLQNGSLRTYLAYMFVALIAALLVAR